MTSIITSSLPHTDDAGQESLHLSDYWHVVLRRRRLVFIILLLIVAAGAARVLLLKPLYQGTVQILIERQLPNIVDYENSKVATEMWEDFYQTQYRLLQSRLLARQVIERLNLLQDPEFFDPSPPLFGAPPGPPPTAAAMEPTIDTFLDRLKVEPVKNTQLLTVGFRSHRPQQAAQVANLLTQLYIRQILEFHNRTSAETGEWLGTETKEESRKVEAAEKALEKFNEDEGLVNIEERRTLLEQKLKDLGSSLTAAKTRKLDKEALYRQMHSSANPEELPEVIASGFIQSLRSELAQLERQNAQLVAKGYLEEHPEVVKVREQIEGTKQKIAAEARRIVRGAENDYRVAVDQEKSVAGALEAAKGESLDLAQRSLKYDSLKRDLDASKKLSENMLTREKETNVARDAQVSNVRIVDAAVDPTIPVSPRPLRDTALSIVLGLLLAVGAAFFRDYLDISVGKPSDVRRLGLPLLGIIPEGNATNGGLVVMNGHRKEAFSEGYRVLRAALHAPTAEGQVLLVTSTLPGEGKSLTAVNLALSLASADERVLVVDADLRRPTINTLLGLRRAPGLCEVLTGVVRLEAAIQRAPGTGLRVLTAGTAVESNPADLLATSAFRDLLVKLRGAYDRIVVDTPPAGAVADALTLAPLAEGVLVVARCGKVTASALSQVLERLAQARGQVVGVVLNRAHPERHEYDYGPYFERAESVGKSRKPLLTPGLRAPSSPGRHH